MGDQQNCGAALVAQALEFVEDLRLHGDIERGGGFVGDQDLRVEGSGDGDHDALAHAAGEFAGEGFGDARGVGQAHLSEGVEGQFARFALFHGAVRGDHLLHLVADGDDRIQPGDGVLEDHGNLVAADLLEFVAVELGDVAALIEHAPGGDAGGAGQDAQDAEAERGFAGAAFADEGENLAAFEGQRGAAQGADRPFAGAVFDAEVFDAEDRRHGAPFRRAV